MTIHVMHDHRIRAFAKMADPNTSEGAADNARASEMMEFSQTVFDVLQAGAADAAAVDKIIAFATERGTYPPSATEVSSPLRVDMSVFYENFMRETGRSVSSSLLESMKYVDMPQASARLKYCRTKNAAELKEIEEKITSSKEHEGELEVLDAEVAKAQFYARIGDKVRCRC